MADGGSTTVEVQATTEFVQITANLIATDDPATACPVSLSVGFESLFRSPPHQDQLTSLL